VLSVALFTQHLPTPNHRPHHTLCTDLSNSDFNPKIECGASLVIGNHPHVLQRIETYQDGLITYSMGSFVFDNFLFPPSYNAILIVELTPQGVASYELIDVIIQSNGVPQIMPYILAP
jgi:hypothetical protein